MLLQTGVRLASLCGRASRAQVAVAAFQQERNASRRSGGGRRDGGSYERGGGGGREPSSSDIWGDDWDIGGSGSGGESSGWLSAAPEGERRDRDSRGGRGDGRGRGGSERFGGGARRDWAPSRSRDDGDRFGGGSSGDWAASRGRGGGGRYGEGGGSSRYGGGGGGGGRKDRGGWAAGQGRGGGGRWGGSDRRQQQQQQQQGGQWQGRGRPFDRTDRDEGYGAKAEEGWGSDADADGDAGGYEPRRFGGGGGGGGGGGLKEYWIGDVLYGVSPVLAALQAGRRDIHTLYLQEGMDLSKRKDKGAIQAAKKRAEELGAAVQYASKHDLNMVADNRPHQGVVLDCSALEFEPLGALPDAPPAGAAPGGRLPVWLCLDEVMDPQNFGAALRSAYFLGVAGVLTCHRNSAPLSAAVSKASAGAMETMAVHSCKSLPQTLADAKSRGWQVLGAAAEPGAQAASSFVLRQPSILVMGNEGYGLRTTVRRLCDAMLRIEEGGESRPALVDSLNVSVATGILLHRLLTTQELSPPSSGGGGGGPESPADVAAALSAVAEEA